MEISVDYIKQSAVIRLTGDLTGEEQTDVFNVKIADLLKENKFNIVVDLYGIKYVNSTGLRMLINGYNILKNSGKELILANCSEKVKDILGYTKLNQVFKIYDNVEDAVNSSA